MYWKKSIVFVMFILLLLSIYHDLQKGLIISEEANIIYVNKQKVTVVKVRAVAGDTILSLIETVNSDEMSRVNINEIISDFKQLNPQLKSNELIVDEYYYVPLYK
jgi:hypothetical protein